MTNKERDALYEVVWDGGEGLIPDRSSKPIETWTQPTRAYNRTGRHTRKERKARKLAEIKLIDVVVEEN